MNRYHQPNSPTNNQLPHTFGPHDIINAQTLRQAKQQQRTVLYTLPGTPITPLAKDLAQQYKIAIETISTFSEEEPSNGPIALGADHGGYHLKEEIKSSLLQWNYTTLDLGTHSTNPVDYPDFAYQVAQAVAQQKAWRGIMIDGVGIGSCMMANKIPGIRAAHCQNIFEIKNSRRHNNANLLCLGGQTLGIGLAKEMVRTWLNEPFEGGRHARRVNKINALDRGAYQPKKD